MTGLRTRPQTASGTALTVVDAATQERVDVVVDLDGTLPGLEASLAALLHPGAEGLWLDGDRLTGPLTETLRPGCVLGLGGPVDAAPAPEGLVLEVVSGCGAGSRVPVDGEVRVGQALVTAGPAGVVVEQPDGATVLRPGRRVDVGDRVVALATARTPPPTSVTRPPRLRSALPVTRLEVPVLPAPPEPRRLAVVPLLLPLLLGAVMALVASPLFLLFCLLSPLMALSQWWSDRGHGRRTRRRQEAAHAEAVAAFEAALLACREQESAARHLASPDPGLTGALGPRLWERRRTDDDALVLRVGTGDLAMTTVRLSEGTPEPLPDVPVTVPLREVGVLGLAGDARPAARWLVAQAAALHAPRDLSTWLLVDPARPPSEPDWGWLRWLPHSRPAGEQDCLALVGSTPDTVAARLADLVALVDSRTAVRRDARAQLHARTQPDVLVVLDGAQGLRSLPGMTEVLRDGPAAGVLLVCLDDRALDLPEECTAVLDDGVLRRDGHPDVPVRPDLVTAAWCEELARSLAPLHVRDDGEAEIPPQARLLDVLHLDPPTVAGVRARAGRTTAAVVGVDADGPVVLDLRRDGPHVLVAGTTGAGKSELLQTLVASLAVANTPEAMTFVLVDYKGGAAFKDCARLPHTVGMVTDLDGHLVERALASLTAELKAREHLLQASGAKDIEDHWRTGAELPRLVIVIDEFASLVEELPDFVRGLVGIAQRGRSLGVHLVLATQRPSGVVSPEIRANANLRLALRVTDPAESLDVLDAPDAATIPRSLPGRACARTGHGVPIAFQTARVGGRRPGTAARTAVAEVTWSEVGAPRPRPAAVDEDDHATDLHALVEAVRAAHLPATRRPWLPPLPLSLVATPAEPLTAVLGREDLPGEQRQQPAVWDVVRDGHLLVAGAPRSGRSTLLRTLAASLAASTPADDVHLYALDCGNGALLPLARLPHTGAVVTRSQPDRADRLLARLTAEVARRQELLATHGWADLAEQRAASPDPLPYLVLLLDRWEGFTAAFDDVDAGRLPETLLRLLREGAAAGLRVVVAGDRSALLGKLTHAIEDVLVLRLAERSDYALAGLSPRSLPDAVTDGRAFRGGSGTEIQVGLLADDASGAAQTAALQALDLPSPQCPPFRVDPLPSRITVAEAGALPGTGLPVGVGGDDLARLGIDLALHGPGFTVAGPSRSGRSTALAYLARGLLDAGTTVCALAPRPSPVRDLPLAHLDTAAAPDPAALAAALNAAPGPVAVVVDDAELLVDSAVADLLGQVLREGRDAGHALVVAGTVTELSGAFRGFAAEVRRSRSGLLLGLTSHLDGELLGVRLPRSAASPGPVGRGLLLRSGEPTAVQVPV